MSSSPDTTTRIPSIHEQLIARVQRQIDEYTTWMGRGDADTDTLAIWRQRRAVLAERLGALQGPEGHFLRYPNPGDAVRLAGPWQWGGLPAGQIGIINGTVGVHRTDDCQITFRYTCFRGRSAEYDGNQAPEHVECSGGPGTIFTPVGELRPTTETIVVTCWRWKSLPCAGGGTSYRIEVPVWEWTPTY